jgi:hypothetical protein
MPAPMPPPIPIGSIGIYPTYLNINSINSVTNFSSEFSNIVPSDGVSYYTDNSRYLMIPIGNSNNRIGVDYTIYNASNNCIVNSNGETNCSILEPDTNIRTGWSSVLRRSNGQPILDQRKLLSNTFQLNIDTMETLKKGGLQFSDFNDTIVYYSNTLTNLTIDTIISLDNLYVKHNNSNYFKLIPYIIEDTEYKFTWFWQILNDNSKPNRVMFVTLSNSFPSTRFVKSDDSNIKISGISLNLVTFPISIS